MGPLAARVYSVSRSNRVRSCGLTPPSVQRRDVVELSDSERGFCACDPLDRWPLRHRSPTSPSPFDNPGRGRTHGCTPRPRSAIRCTVTLRSAGCRLIIGNSSPVPVCFSGLFACVIVWGRPTRRPAGNRSASDFCRRYRQRRSMEVDIDWPLIIPLVEQYFQWNSF